MAFVIHMRGMLFQRTAPRSALRFSHGASSCRGSPLDPDRFGSPRCGASLLSDAPLAHLSLRGVMPFVQNGLEVLDSLISLRLTTREKAKLKDDADLAGLSVSELVRRRYFGRPIVANADAIMIKELRRLGGLLKHVHVESDGAYSRETAAALQAVKACVEAISAKPNESARDRASKKAQS